MNSAISESDIVRVVEEAIEEHGKSREALVPILSEVNTGVWFHTNRGNPRDPAANPQSGRRGVPGRQPSVLGRQFLPNVFAQTARRACHSFLCQRPMPCHGWASQSSM